jgi:isopenicillin-N epimerase
VISWGLDQGFTAEFDWVGTRDPSAWLAAPAGIAFLHDLGIDALRSYNHDLAWRAARMLTDRWSTDLGVGEASVGFMVTVPLPPVLGTTVDDAARLRDALLFEDGIEVQVHAACGRPWARVSAQVYNEWGDFEQLADAVAARARQK